MSPWWYRIFFPPRGLYLIGSGAQGPDINYQRRKEQRVRSFFLHKIFKTKLPSRFLKPQPAIIIVDQAEELLRAYRSNFLVCFYNLAKEARDTDLFRLVLLVNTENGVKALKLMNGGNIRDVVEKSYGENLAQIFDDCNGCIGVAMDYVFDKEHAKVMTAKETKKVIIPKWMNMDVKS
eukprot:gene33826-43707_t